MQEAKQDSLVEATGIVTTGGHTNWLGPDALQTVSSPSCMHLCHVHSYSWQLQDQTRINPLAMIPATVILLKLYIQFLQPNQITSHRYCIIDKRPGRVGRKYQCEP